MIYQFICSLGILRVYWEANPRALNNYIFFTIGLTESI